MEKYVGTGVTPGLMISSPQFSASANIRNLGRVIDQFSKEVHKQVYETGLPMIQIFQDVYDKYGTGSKAFANWFVRDPKTGEIDERFILKDPDTSDLRSDPIARKAVRTMLDILAKLKHPEFTEEQLEEYRSTEEYHQVPLMEAAANRQLKNLGLKKMLKNKIQQAKHLTQGLFQDEDDFGTITNHVDNAGTLYNKFNLSSTARQERLNKYIATDGIGFFETDLELVFNAALVAYTKTNVSRKYVPIITGMKLAMAYADNIGSSSANMTNLTETVDKLVKSKFYGESIIESKMEQKILKT